jgi:hypothetical protein
MPRGTVIISSRSREVVVVSCFFLAVRVCGVFAIDFFSQPCRRYATRLWSGMGKSSLVQPSIFVSRKALLFLTM